MPRPGPRPYECVRRAWHSDRHQPIRGSLIQEIFRVVNEIHCSSTKKNKEWQEKLPIVVLKAEEIMYSKANSEAEYIDLDTLVHRANDAINTIIRRDESETNETGDLLQPCIEAALTLGCTPRRTLRSQRNNTPHCYLSGNSQEPPAATKDQISLWQPDPLVNCASNNNFLFLEKVVASTDALVLPPSQSQSQLSICSVYPLYYGSCPEGKTLPCSFRFLDDRSSGLIEQESNKNSSNKKPEMTSSCDLSLRLGPHPSWSGFLHENEPLKRQKLCHRSDVEDDGSHWLSCGSASEVVPRHPGS